MRQNIDTRQIHVLKNSYQGIVKKLEGHILFDEHCCTLKTVTVVKVMLEFIPKRIHQTHTGSHTVYGLVN